MTIQELQELRHYRNVIKMGFKRKVDFIIKNNDVDIDPSFLGFLNIYEQLSKIIPTERTILDFGCSYGIQAIYFLKHKNYVGIDISNCKKLKTKNSIYYNMSIKNFIKDNKRKYENVFAISSYVPSDEVELIRNNFNDLFVYYVSKFDCLHLSKPLKK